MAMLQKSAASRLHARSRWPVHAPRLHVVSDRPSAQTRVSFIQFSDSEAAPNLQVEIHPTADDAACSLVSKVENAALAAIKEKGSFTLAVPGGSVLKMLWGLSINKGGVDWTKVHMFYVNHKCVPIDDNSSTHKKAEDYFLSSLSVPPENVAHLKGTPDAVKEAHIYEERLKRVAVDLEMPMTANGVPRFDMMVIGMGADGHVGSLYPNRPETTTTDGCVLSVDKKEPSSITLSAAVMSAAKHIVISMTGSSKASTVRQALEDELPAGVLPVQMVRGEGDATVTWLMDSAAASELAVAKAAKSLRATKGSGRVKG